MAAGSGGSGNDFSLSFGSNAKEFARDVTQQVGNAKRSLNSLNDALKQYDEAVSNKGGKGSGGSVVALGREMDAALNNFSSTMKSVTDGLAQATKDFGGQVRDMQKQADRIDAALSGKTPRRTSAGGVSDATAAAGAQQRNQGGRPPSGALGTAALNKAVERLGRLNATLFKNSNEAGDAVKNVSAAVRELRDSLKELDRDMPREISLKGLDFSALDFSGLENIVAKLATINIQADRVNAQMGSAPAGKPGPQARKYLHVEQVQPKIAEQAAQARAKAMPERMTPRDRAYAYLAQMEDVAKRKHSEADDPERKLTAKQRGDARKEAKELEQTITDTRLSLSQLEDSTLDVATDLKAAGARINKYFNTEDARKAQAKVAANQASGGSDVGPRSNAQRVANAEASMDQLIRGMLKVSGAKTQLEPAITTGLGSKDKAQRLAAAEAARNQLVAKKQTEIDQAIAAAKLVPDDEVKAAAKRVARIREKVMANPDASGQQRGALTRAENDHKKVVERFEKVRTGEVNRLKAEMAELKRLADALPDVVTQSGFGEKVGGRKGRVKLGPIDGRAFGVGGAVIGDAGQAELATARERVATDKKDKNAELTRVLLEALKKNPLLSHRDLGGDDARELRSVLSQIDRTTIAQAEEKRASGARVDPELARRELGALARNEERRLAYEASQQEKARRTATTDTFGKHKGRGTLLQPYKDGAYAQTSIDGKMVSYSSLYGQFADAQSLASASQHTKDPKNAKRLSGMIKTLERRFGNFHTEIVNYADKLVEKAAKRIEALDGLIARAEKKGSLTVGDQTFTGAELKTKITSYKKTRDELENSITGDPEVMVKDLDRQINAKKKQLEEAKTLLLEQERLRSPKAANTRRTVSGLERDLNGKDGKSGLVGHRQALAGGDTKALEKELQRRMQPLMEEAAYEIIGRIDKGVKRVQDLAHGNFQTAKQIRRQQEGRLNDGRSYKSRHDAVALSGNPEVKAANREVGILAAAIGSITKKAKADMHRQTGSNYGHERITRDDPRYRQLRELESAGELINKQRQAQGLAALEHTTQRLQPTRHQGRELADLTSRRRSAVMDVERYDRWDPKKRALNTQHEKDRAEQAYSKAQAITTSAKSARKAYDTEPNWINAEGKRVHDKTLRDPHRIFQLDEAVRKAEEDEKKKRLRHFAVKDKDFDGLRGMAQKEVTRLGGEIESLTKAMSVKVFKGLTKGMLEGVLAEATAKRDAVIADVKKPLTATKAQEKLSDAQAKRDHAASYLEGRKKVRSGLTRPGDMDLEIEKLEKGLQQKETRLKQAQRRLAAAIEREKTTGQTSAPTVATTTEAKGAEAATKRLSDEMAAKKRDLDLVNRQLRGSDKGNETLISEAKSLEKELKKLATKLKAAKDKLAQALSQQAAGEGHKVGSDGTFDYDGRLYKRNKAGTGFLRQNVANDKFSPVGKNQVDLIDALEKAEKKKGKPAGTAETRDVKTDAKVNAATEKRTKTELTAEQATKNLTTALNGATKRLKEQQDKLAGGSLTDRAKKSAENSVKFQQGRVQELNARLEKVKAGDLSGEQALAAQKAKTRAATAGTRVGKSEYDYSRTVEMDGQSYQRRKKGGFYRMLPEGERKSASHTKGIVRDADIEAKLKTTFDQLDIADRDLNKATQAATQATKKRKSRTSGSGGDAGTGGGDGGSGKGGSDKGLGGGGNIVNVRIVDITAAAASRLGGSGVATTSKGSAASKADGQLNVSQRRTKEEYRRQFGLADAGLQKDLLGDPKNMDRAVAAVDKLVKKGKDLQAARKMVASSTNFSAEALAAAGASRTKDGNDGETKSVKKKQDAYAKFIQIGKSFTAMLDEQLKKQLQLIAASGKTEAHLAQAFKLIESQRTGAISAASGGEKKAAVANIFELDENSYVLLQGAHKAGKAAARDFERGMSENMGLIERTKAKMYGNREGAFADRVQGAAGNFIVRDAAASAVFGVKQLATDGIRAGLETEKTFIRLSSALESVGNSGDGMRNKLSGISRELGIPLEDVYETASQLAGVFHDELELVQATTLAHQLQLISGGALNTTEAFRTLTAVTTAFKQEFQEAGLTGVDALQRTSDVAVVLQNKLGVNIEDTLEGVSRLGPIARQYGLQLEEIATLTDIVGKSTGQTGQAASEAFGRILSRVGQGGARAALTESMVGRNGKTIKLGEESDFARGRQGQVLMNLVRNWENLTDSQQANFASLLGGNREYAAFMGLVTDSGRTMETIQAAFNAQGATTERIAKITETLAVAFSRLKQQFSNFATILVRSGFLHGLKVAGFFIGETLGIITTLGNTILDFTDTLKVTPLIQYAIGLGILAAALRATAAAFGLNGMMAGAASLPFVGGVANGVARRGAAGAAGRTAASAAVANGAGVMGAYGAARAARAADMAHSGRAAQAASARLAAQVVPVAAAAGAGGIASIALPNTTPVSPGAPAPSPAGAAGRATARIGALGASFTALLNPITALLGAVAALGYASYKASGSYKDLRKALADEVRDKNGEKPGLGNEEETAPERRRNLRQQTLEDFDWAGKVGDKGWKGFKGQLKRTGMALNPWGGDFGDFTEDSGVNKEAIDKFRELKTKNGIVGRERGDNSNLSVEDAKQRMAMYMKQQERIDAAEQDILDSAGDDPVQQAKAGLMVDTLRQSVQAQINNMQMIISGMNDIDMMSVNQFQDMMATLSGMGNMSDRVFRQQQETIEAISNSMELPDSNSAAGKALATFKAPDTSYRGRQKAKVAVIDALINQGKMDLNDKDKMIDKDALDAKEAELASLANQRDEAMQRMARDIIDGANALMEYFQNRGDIAGATRTANNAIAEIVTEMEALNNEVNNPEFIALAARAADIAIKAVEISQTAERVAATLNAASSDARTAAAGARALNSLDQKAIEQANAKLIFHNLPQVPATRKAQTQAAGISMANQEAASNRAYKAAQAQRKISGITDSGQNAQARLNENLRQQKEMRGVDGAQYESLRGEEARIRTEIRNITNQTAAAYAAVKIAGIVDPHHRAQAQLNENLRQQGVARRTDRQQLLSLQAEEARLRIELAQTANQMATAKAAIEIAKIQDPVRAAQAQLNENLRQQAVARKTDTMQLLSLQAEEVRLRQAQAQALGAQRDAEFNLAIALDEAAGNTVTATQRRLQMTQESLARTRETGNQTAILSAEAEKVRAEASVKDVMMNDQLDTIRFNLEMNRISASSAAEQVKSMLAAQHWTRDQRRALERELKGLQSQMDGQWNLGDISLPTPYQVRRMAQGGGAGTQVNTTQNVSVVINGGDVNQMKQVLAMYLGQQNMQRTATASSKF